MRLLYVEDNPLDADLVRRVLEGAFDAVEVDVAPTLEAARERLAGAPPYELVLTDLNLPDGNGLDLVREIRERRLPSVVVALTSQGDESIVLAALRAGADDYLGKDEALTQRLPATLRAALERCGADDLRRGRVLRVLYAEHDAADIDMTRRHFEREAPHLQLQVVHDAAGALAALPGDAETAAQHDVLMLDYRLVGDSALEVLKTVRDERRLDLPVVIVTGQGNEDVAARSMRLGATDYVVKRGNYLAALPLVLENAFHRVRAAREHAALRRSEERLALALRGSSDAPWDLDLVRGERWVSPRLWEMLGLQAPEPGEVTRSLEERLEPHTRAEARRRFVEALKGAGALFETELRLRHRDGHDVEVLARAFISRDASGRAVRVSGTCTDLTERKRAEARIRELNATLERRVAARTRELEQANRELEAFSYSVSHDLRAPLRAIEGLAALLQQEHGATLGDEGRRKLQLLLATTANMDRLIQDLLEFARTARHTLTRTTVPAEALVRHCLESFRAEIDARGIAVEVGALPPCDADPSLLRQVFLNLIGNAVKYTRKQPRPRVDVSAYERDGTTVYCVRDNGAGFDMARAGKLFTVFQRLHRDAEFEGTGVGLAIVDRIVKRHDGRVWAEAAPGAGAAFHFTLGPAAT